MPDITMCVNKSCPKRKTCYRFLAEPDTYQSYANYNYKLDKCYWDIEDNDEEE